VPASTPGSDSQGCVLLSLGRITLPLDLFSAECLKTEGIVVEALAEHSNKWASRHPRRERIIVRSSTRKVSQRSMPWLGNTTESRPQRPFIDSVKADNGKFPSIPENVNHLFRRWSAIAHGRMEAYETVQCRRPHLLIVRFGSADFSGSSTTMRRREGDPDVRRARHRAAGWRDAAPPQISTMSQ